MSRDEIIKCARDLSLDDRAVVAAAIWQSIREETQSAGSTEKDQWQELDRRLADYEANPQDTLTLDQLKASLEMDRIVFIGVIHASRDPAVWQQRA